MTDSGKAIVLWLAALAGPFVFLPLVYEILVAVAEAFGPLAPRPWPECVGNTPVLDCRLTAEWQAYVKTDAYVELERMLAARGDRMWFTGRGYLANDGSGYLTWTLLGYLPSVVAALVAMMRYGPALNVLLHGLFFVLVVAVSVFWGVSFGFYTYGM